MVDPHISARGRRVGEPGTSRRDAASKRHRVLGRFSVTFAPLLALLLPQCETPCFLLAASFPDAGIRLILHCLLCGAHGILRARAGAYTAGHETFVVNFGLYWHFIDIVWIYLFALLYLISRH